MTTRRSTAQAAVVVAAVAVACFTNSLSGKGSYVCTSSSCFSEKTALVLQAGIFSMTGVP
jgi:hypothetical protein